MRLPNGYGSVIKLSGKRRKPFAARITTGFIENGFKDGIPQFKQAYKYIGYFEKRIEALNCLIEYNNSPYDLNARKLTFSEVYNAWSDRKFNSLSESSIKNYKVVYRKFEPLHNLPFTTLKAAHYQKIIDENKKLSNIGHFKVILSQLYDYALKNEIVEKDYSNFIEIPQIEKKRPKQPFTKKEIELLKENKNQPYLFSILILLYTGFRIQELLNIKLIDIKLKDRYLIIEKSKTNAGIRNVPIHREIKPYIELALKNNENYLIERKNKPIKYAYYLRHIFTPIMEALKMDHTPHETRHTFISQCDRLNLKSIDVKKIVGHKSNDITAHYTHKDIDDLVKTIDLFYY